MSDFHADFADALLRGDEDALTAHLPDPADRARFAVYRNNVVRAAIEALRAAYPAVNRLVGDEFFAPMARAYWEARPPTARSLTLYGEGFADHVSAYPPAAGLGYLPDVARLDRAWQAAHHAKEAAVLEPAAIAAMPPDLLPELAPRLHPSAHLFRFRGPAYDIWRRNREGDETVRIGEGAQCALVWRRGGAVAHRRLEPDEHAFLSALDKGANLAAAAEAGLARNPEFDAAAAFGAALSHACLGGLKPHA